jgi:anti-sigma factor ChrR (cupin superfamily)
MKTIIQADAQTAKKALREWAKDVEAVGRKLGKSSYPDAAADAAFWNALAMAAGGRREVAIAMDPRMLAEGRHRTANNLRSPVPEIRLEAAVVLAWLDSLQ